MARSASCARRVFCISERQCMQRRLQCPSLPDVGSLWTQSGVRQQRQSCLSVRAMRFHAPRASTSAVGQNDVASWFGRGGAWLGTKTAAKLDSRQPARPSLPVPGTWGLGRGSASPYVLRARASSFAYSFSFTALISSPVGVCPADSKSAIAFCTTRSTRAWSF
jgi:hypothetical protein